MRGFVCCLYFYSEKQQENLDVSISVKVLPIWKYCKIPKFSDSRKHCNDLPKIQTKTPNFKEFHLKGANGIANSEDPDQTAPLGAV